MKSCWDFAARLARSRSPAHVAPVRLHVPRGCVVTFVHAEDRFQFSFNGRIGDGRHGFHAIIEISIGLQSWPKRRTASNSRFRRREALRKDLAAMASLVYGQLPQTTTEEAVRCFKKALELNPNRLMHYVELGRAYAQMGRTAEAGNLLKRDCRCRTWRKTIRKPNVADGDIPQGFAQSSGPVLKLRFDYAVKNEPTTKSAARLCPARVSTVGGCQANHIPIQPGINGSSTCGDSSHL